MINSRDDMIDSYESDLSYQVPYSIGTILERIDNPDQLVKIAKYIIEEEDINVILIAKIYEDEQLLMEPITLKELNNFWKETDKVIITSKKAIETRPGLGIASKAQETHGYFEVTDKGVIKKVFKRK